MNNDQDKREVVLQGHPGFAVLSPIGTFVLCILCFAFWAFDIGILPEGSQLALGLLAWAAFIPYLIAGLNLARLGLTFAANTYLVFGAVFGACGGFFNTFAPIFAHRGIPFDYTLFGVPLLLAGIYMFFMLPGALLCPKADFFIFLFAAIGVTSTALTVLGWVPAFFVYISGWGLFLNGVAGLWSVIGVQLNSMGVRFPLGKPFRSAKS